MLNKMTLRWMLLSLSGNVIDHFLHIYKDIFEDYLSQEEKFYKTVAVFH